jgi:hypothetical protein
MDSDAWRVYSPNQGYGVVVDLWWTRWQLEQSSSRFSTRLFAGSSSR